MFSYLSISSATYLKPRIIKGIKAKPNQFPFYVFLEIIYPLYEDREQDTCGSAIISDEWLISAAHCLTDTEKVIAHFGISNLNEISRPKHQSITVEKIHFRWYPKYIEFMKWNDIGLIHLPQKIKFSQNVRLVALPRTCESPETVDVVTMGNGVVSNSRKIPSKKLLFANMKTLSMQDCRKTYRFLTFRKSVICANNHVEKQSVCKGDSGSPLIKTSDGIMIGVAVFTPEEGCESGEAQGFTNIYSYLKWIEEVTGIELPSC